MPCPHPAQAPLTSRGSASCVRPCMPDTATADHGEDCIFEDDQAIFPKQFNLKKGEESEKTWGGRGATQKSIP